MNTDCAVHQGWEHTATGQLLRSEARRHPGNLRAQQRGAWGSTSSWRPPAFWWDSAPRTLLHF